MTLLATEPQGTAPLETSELRVRFGGTTALDDVSFTVGRGDIVAVVGPNGAGKTTLLNAISGLLGRGVSGVIRLQGHDITHKRPAAICRLGLGRSFQDPPLVDGSSVFDNVMTGAHVALRYGIGNHCWRRLHVHAEELRVADHVDQILDICGLADHREERAGSLPYGQRKLIDIARALVPEPPVLLLDEPTSGVDPDERNAIKELIVELNRSRGAAIVLIEHHIELVAEVAHKILGLQAGHVIAFGDASSVMASSAFRAALVGEDVASEPTTGEPAPAPIKSSVAGVIGHG